MVGSDLRVSIPPTRREWLQLPLTPAWSGTGGTACCCPNIFQQIFTSFHNFVLVSDFEMSLPAYNTVTKDTLDKTFVKRTSDMVLPTLTL